MKQVVKRLELINCAISLEEKEIISSQTKKLRNYSLDAEAEVIVEMLEKRLYEDVISNIKNYVRKFSDLSAYEDPRIRGIRVEIKTFEQDLNNLTYIKYKDFSKLYDFNVLYHKTIGDLILDILKIQLDKSKVLLDANQIDKKTFMKNDNRYEEFFAMHEKIKNIQQHSLSKDQNIELQRLYKKIISQINPLIVTTELEKNATELFAKANTAYINKDISTLNKISENLYNHSNVVYGYEKIEDKKELKDQSNFLRKKIQELQNDIDYLHENEIYTIAVDEESLKEYFIKIKKHLEQKKIHLQQN